METFKKDFCKTLSISCSVVDSEHFFYHKGRIGISLKAKKHFVRKLLPCDAEKSMMF
jgi:hypothetical protein